MPDGEFHKFLQGENNKRLKLFVENPEWKKMFVSLFVVASDEANRLSCTIEELEVVGQVISPTLSSMSWQFIKNEKSQEEKYQALTERKFILESGKGNRTYTLEDILTKNLHDLSMMSPGNTKQFMGTMDRVILIKGYSGAMKVKFSNPSKTFNNRFKIDLSFRP